MINFPALKAALDNSSIAVWTDFLEKAVAQRYSQYTHGEANQWQQLLANLPEIEVSQVELKDQVALSTTETLNSTQLSSLIDQLKILHPWRKGPFQLFGINLDTEWRSDWKWQRILPHISPLKDRTVLDVGCGNGYHCWRMIGEDARLVLGIDPSQKFLAQFSVLQHFLKQPNCHLLPLGIEDMPSSMENNGFDSVFCMGVLYHQKSPINLLQKLLGMLNKNGELILETLVVDGDENTVLVPSSRYAQMRNVWFLPSVKALELWLKKCGFKSVHVADVNQTSTQEQRTTKWMTFHSLANFLDPNDPNKTIEGYPAPKRATLIAKK